MDTASWRSLDILDNRCQCFRSMQGLVNKSEQDVVDYTREKFTNWPLFVNRDGSTGFCDQSLVGADRIQIREEIHSVSLAFII